jgi:putative transposon-encoded protein
MPDNKNTKEMQNIPAAEEHEKVKFEVYGEEMVEKVVKLSGNSGRVYLPPDWVGSRVKIVRMD